MADAGEKLSKSEQKRRQKEEKKAKEKAEKLAAQAKEEQEKTVKTNDEDIDPNEYFKLRSRAVAILKEQNDNPYPHKFHVQLSLVSFIEKYGNISDGTILEDTTVTVSGRIHSRRESGAKLLFYDLRAEDVKIQIMANAKYYASEEEFSKMIEKVKRGDIVGIEGHPGKTKKGELSIIPKKIVLLSPCLHQLPSLHFGVKDKETRFRQRYLDLIINSSTRHKFITRAKIFNFLRRYFDQLGFLE
ncbi:hypothetical protein DPMN_170395, partial [Dreissena polymorpha]